MVFINTESTIDKDESISLKSPVPSKTLLTLLFVFFLLLALIVSYAFIADGELLVPPLMFALFLIIVIIRVLIQPRAELEIVFYQDHLSLPSKRIFYRQFEVRYKDIYSVVTLGKKSRQQLFIDTNKRIFKYSFKNIISLTNIEQFLDILSPHVKAQPDGESHWQGILERNELFAQANKRKGIVGWGLCAILFAVFLFELYMGVGQNKMLLLNWGANAQILVRAGEWFRLFNSNFLHLDFTHFVSNISALVIVGMILERLIGGWRFMLIYLISALGGAITSMLITNAMFSVGSSTAIYGLVGAFAVINLKFHNQLPILFRIPIRNWILFIVLIVLYTIIVPQVDNAAHIGGFIAGAGIAFIIYWGCPRLDILLKPSSWVFTTVILISIIFLFAGSIGIKHARMNKDNNHDMLHIVSEYIKSPNIKPAFLNNLAWMLATQAKIDDEELKLAQKIAERAVNEDSRGEYLDTLATIYYLSGLFNKAIITESQALVLKEDRHYASQLVYFLSSRAIGNLPFLLGTNDSSIIQFDIKRTGVDKEEYYVIQAKMNEELRQGIIAYLKVSQDGEDIGVIRFAIKNPQQKIYFSNNKKNGFKKNPDLSDKSAISVMLIDFRAGSGKFPEDIWRYWPLDREIRDMYRRIL